MNPITPWLVCVVLVAALVFVIYVAIKTNKSKTQEIKRISAELEKQKKNVVYLVKHAEEVTKIGHDKDKVQEAIQNAKTDEEVVDVINSIISANNNRVRK